MKKFRRLIAVLLVVSTISGMSLPMSAAVCNNGGTSGWIEQQNNWDPYYYYGVGEAWCSYHTFMSVYIEIWDGGLVAQATNSGYPLVRAVTNTIYGSPNGLYPVHYGDCLI